MVIALFLTALIATSGLAISGSQEEGASHTLIAGHPTGKVSVMIDGYTHNSTLTSGDSVPLGTQLILVCQAVGLPYGTPHSYTWTCPNGDCIIPGHHSYVRKVYNDHILAVNTTDLSSGGTYTCQMTASGGQHANGSFTINVTGVRVVAHSFGRLIPHEYVITDLQQISGPDGLGRIICTVSSGPARFHSSTEELEAGGVTASEAGSMAVLTVNTTNIDIFENRDMYCGDLQIDHVYFYLYPTPNSILAGVDVTSVTSSQVVYETTAHRRATRVITGYEVFRFGVPMIGEYVNTGTGRRVTISPAVPGTQYRITAWALDDFGRRGAGPAVVYAITGEAAPSPPRSVTITRVFQDGVELNWLPPTEPNEEMHYVIEYRREDSGSWTSVNTTSDSTHYNLTGLHSGTNYAIRVVSENSVGRESDDTPFSFHITIVSAEENTEAVVAGILVSFLFLTLLITGIITGLVIWRRALGRQRKASKKKKDAYQKKDNTAVQPPEVAGESTEEPDSTRDHAYDYVIEEGSTEGRGGPYQELEVETQDYVSMYTQLGGGTYQELDCRGKEDDHHYQRAGRGREGYGTRN